MRFLLLCLLLTTLISCTTNDSTAPEDNAAVPDITEQLPGTWETIEVEVRYQSWQGQDTTVTEIIREADWGKTYGVLPPRTTFGTDEKIERIHRLRNGDVVDVVHGIWKVHAPDSLLFIEPSNLRRVAWTMTTGRLETTELTDADKDGVADDEQRTVLRLVSRTQ